MGNAVLFEKRNGIAVITMNLPERMNSLVPDMTAGLYNAMLSARDDDEVRAVILTGKDKSFCAGGDISSMKGGITLGDGINQMDVVHQKWAAELYAMRKPTIAAVNGFAVGAGFGIALLCDIVFACESAKFSLSFSNVALSPDYALGYMLPRIIGLHAAKDLFFTAKNITAKEALDMRLVNRVTGDGEVLAAAEEYALKLAKGPTLAYALGKRLFNSSLDMDIKNALTLEAYTQSILVQTEDCAEAADAFFSKRKPEFKGK
jgi:2-(1,2-epoxy-1,2-dihydrophenyl)acetyl-CoA isomerase